MSSCTVIISHYNSIEFLKRCVHQIRIHSNPEIRQHIIISDQSNDETHAFVQALYSSDPGITIYRSKPLYSGYGIDCIMRFVKIDTEYICQLHADAFPIHNNWLFAPISLMKKYDLSFSGVLQFICNKPEPIYPYIKSFFSMAQSFHIGRYDICREMALYGGFTRYHNRKMADQTISWLNDDWDRWAEEDYDRRGSDDDVPAFCWQDNHRNDNKAGFGVTARIGVMQKESGYGSIVEDMVFHFGFHLESRGVMEYMGERYRSYISRIKEDFSDELFYELLNSARLNNNFASAGRTYWDGKNKICFPFSEEMNNDFEHFKNIKHEL